MLRRKFLDGLFGGGAVVWLGSVLYPVLRFLKPLPQAAAKGAVRLGSADRAALGRAGFVIVAAGARRLLVFEDRDKELRALDARCTHEGCTVQFVPGENVVWCACHDARFGVDGAVLSGPPPRPLPRFHTRRDAQGDILVDPEGQ